MADSTYLDTPPANHLGYRIAKGMLVLSSVTANGHDPTQGVRIPPFPPDNYLFETKVPGILTGLSICMLVIVVVTLTHLHLRLFVRSLTFGADDYLMVPALSLAVAYLSLQIAMVTMGGAGKHIARRDGAHYLESVTPGAVFSDRAKR